MRMKRIAYIEMIAVINVQQVPGIPLLNFPVPGSSHLVLSRCE